MEIFKLHADIMGDYRSYIDSFVNIQDEDIAAAVKDELSSGKLWPEPLIQFNPSFEIHGRIEDFTGDGTLHPELRDIFKGYRLYRHQVDAIRLGVQSKDFVVTSGTGSGKSLTYIGTIFNHLLENRASLEPGVKAVIVYPMNALINSQREEINRYAENYKKETGKDFPISYGQYTGQEDEATRRKWRDNPPDILLTNYMMLELLLSRDADRAIKQSVYENLQYLVFDELHTYRGRQGADVALLIRRIKSCCHKSVVCIGTSATMVAGEDSIMAQREEVAKVAQTIFGTKFEASQVINETLSSSFGHSGPPPSTSELAKCVGSSVDTEANENDLKRYPTALWLEQAVALDTKDGVLVRRKPMTFSEIGAALSEASGIDKGVCSDHLQAVLRWISTVNAKVTEAGSRKTYLPFKLHQFISQTGSVYVTLEEPGIRRITLEPGMAVATDDGAKSLFPLVFSRHSGAAFACVTLNYDIMQLEPREFRSASSEDEEEPVSNGYLILDPECWNPAEDMENLPEAWLKRDRSGTITGPVKKYADRFPQKIHYDSNGRFSGEAREGYPLFGWFMSERLLFDPTSGTLYDTKTNEGTKLTQLGSEGRSTSTTITTFSILNRMAGHGFHVKDQKLLSFTDNRQDAALQAGHFNDYISVIRLRAAIYQAVKRSSTRTLDYRTLGAAVKDALNLPFTEYANMETEPRFANVKREYDEALQTYLVYRALYDLRRSWRVVLPNLEQCALLTIEYDGLESICSDEGGWREIPLANRMDASQRHGFIQEILEYFRLSYAIYSENYLTCDMINKNQKEITEKLRSPWKFEKSEDIQEPYCLRYSTLPENNRRFTASMGAQSRLGKYIREVAKKYGMQDQFKGADYNVNIRQLMDVLCEAGYLRSEPMRDRTGEDTLVYQLRIDKVVWVLGDEETVRSNIVNTHSYKGLEIKPNLFFKRVYQTDFGSMKKLASADHTGQLRNEDRLDREERFRVDWKGDDGQPDVARIRSESISALFCSPTMELGIDISNLSIVHMRNAPPNPANYAQRSGRAGRSGQAALVFTYCSTYSSHDRHYFQNARDMVAGIVAAPRLDLVNEDLLRTHLNALFLSEVGLPELRESLENLVDSSKISDLPLKPEIREKLRISPAVEDRIRNVYRRTVHDFKGELEVRSHGWFTDDWIAINLAAIADNLDGCMRRWRNLYINAMRLLETATDQIKSGRFAVGSRENKQAKSNMHQAQRQIDLLVNDRTGNNKQLSEFYPYRYLASEGFLPGYNFTRLPLRVYIPKGDDGEFIARPRSIALREFGPENRIYHSGSKYRIKQLVVQDAENNLKKAKVCKSSGYILMDGCYDQEMCPFTGVSMHNNDDKEIFLDLLEMSETVSEEMDRISCEEEERVSQGYEIDIHFSIDSENMDRVSRAYLKNEDEHYLNVRYIPAARMHYINKKWRSSQEKGFPMGMTSGLWKRKLQVEENAGNPEREPIRNVMLFTTDVADALYLEPIAPLGLELDGVLTLQYALKRAIENIFQVESSEIGVQCMGGADDTPNIFLYESAEGSLGVLSRFVQSPEVFGRVIDEAIKVCRFDEDPGIPATYNDLLSYYNQRFHKQIDRELIRDALQKLKCCTVEIQTNKGYENYDAQFESLMTAMDPNSSTEREFLQYLYKNGLRLPDSAQQRVPGIYVQPDFFYEPDIHVFCDGTPHDQGKIKEVDTVKRQQLRSMGFKVIEYYYQNNLADLVNSRPDVFKKVR
ncbi:MAG: DEAD/DEAH box helicase [Lentisphaerae bacterium]|nr:DEAD/DEAH box helicase [Lentisphaerota bacterium]